MKRLAKIFIFVIVGIISGYNMSYAETHYEVLGISQDATPDEIKSAYRKASLKWHPDKNPSPDATAMFQRIGEAYTTLSDPSARSTYDWVLKSKQREAEAGQKGKKQQQQYAGRGELVIEQSAQPSKPIERFNFEIMNKASNPIFVTIQNDGKTLVENRQVAGSRGSAGTYGYLRLSGINTTKPTILIVRYLDDARIYTVDTDQGETIFLTWDKNNFPRPQTGPLFGLLGQTESGLSLGDNIGKNQIRQSIGN